VSPARHWGLGLVEVAVTVLLVSIAVLGISRARLLALETAYAARQSERAADLADSLLEISRGDPGALPGYQLSADGALAPPAQDCRLASCDSDPWGDWNLWHWLQQLQGEAVTDAGGQALGGLALPLACVEVSEPWITVRLNWQWRADDVAPPADCLMMAHDSRDALVLRSRVGAG
jgi:hypothetical protein